MNKILIGVMGPGEQATAAQIDTAFALGSSLAQQGWGVLTGGRNVGVMEAACRGAKVAGGLTVGILPSCERAILSEAVDIAIFTDLGSGRNNVNVLSSQVVVACGMGAGTAAEVALAIKANKPVVLIAVDSLVQAFFQSLSAQPICLAATVAEALTQIQRQLDTCC